MTYAGFLRIRNCLRVLAIVAGIAVLAMVAGRVYLATTKLVISTGAHVRAHVLDNSSIVNVDAGQGSTNVRVVPPDQVKAGATKIGYYANQPAQLDVTDPAVLGLVFGMIIATLLGGPLARENDGHLEIAWTKPASRSKYALAVMAVDVAGILAAVLLGSIVALIAIMLFAAPQFSVSSEGLIALGICILAPTAWYAMCAAFTSSLKRGWRAIPGLAWPVALILPLLATIGADPNSNAALRLVHAGLSAINYFNPLIYSGISVGDNATRVAAPIGGESLYSLVALAMLIVGYTLASLLQWRRVEA